MKNEEGVAQVSGEDIPGAKAGKIEEESVPENIEKCDDIVGSEEMVRDGKVS